MCVMIRSRSSAEGFGVVPEDRISGSGATAVAGAGGSISGSEALGFDEAQLRKALTTAAPPPPPPNLFSFRSNSDGVGLPDYGLAIVEQADGSMPKPPPPPSGPPPPRLPSTQSATLDGCVASGRRFMLGGTERTPSFRARKVNERISRARQSAMRNAAAAAGSERARAALRTIPAGLEVSTRAAVTRRTPASSWRDSDASARLCRLLAPV